MNGGASSPLRIVPDFSQSNRSWISATVKLEPTIALNSSTCWVLLASSKRQIAKKYSMIASRIRPAFSLVDGSVEARVTGSTQSNKRSKIADASLGKSPFTEVIFLYTFAACDVH